MQCYMITYSGSKMVATVSTATLVITYVVCLRTKRNTEPGIVSISKPLNITIWIAYAEQ